MDMTKIWNDEMNRMLAVFEKEAILSLSVIKNDDNLDLETYEDYLSNRVEMVFIDKYHLNGAGFTLELSQRMFYERMAAAVGQKINVDPNKIQFFRCQNFKELSGNSIDPVYEGPISDFLIFGKSKKKLFFEILPINVTELKNKKQFKCFWLTPNLKEGELFLYPDKRGTVIMLIEEASKHVEFSKDGTRQLRMVTIGPSPREDTEIEHLHQPGVHYVSQQIFYRFEEIPHSEMNLAEDEMLIPVSHFYKNLQNLFGVPFFVKIKHGERFRELKRRLQNKLGVPNVDWEKYKFALISMGRAEYISDDDIF